MWHDDSEATNASSGSTPFGSFQGAGTMCGLGEAGTTAPPSKTHSCARLYWPLAKSPSPVRLQRIVAVYVLIASLLLSGVPRACCDYATDSFSVIPTVEESFRGVT